MCKSNGPIHIQKTHAMTAAMMLNRPEARLAGALAVGPVSARKYMRDAAWDQLARLSEKAVGDNRIDYLVHAQAHDLPMSEHIPDMALDKGRLMISAWALLNGMACRKKNKVALYKDDLVRWYFVGGVCLVKGCSRSGEGVCNKHRTLVCDVFVKHTCLPLDIIATIMGILTRKG